MSSVTIETSSVSECLQRRYIITGGPGVGKSSIVRNLASRGESVVHEAATDVIQQELANGVDAPWAKVGFREKIVALQEERQFQAMATRVQRVFFDRTPIDTYTYCLRFEAEPTPELLNAVNRVIDEAYYDKTVFLIENFGSCSMDEVRCEDQEESLLMQENLRNMYTQLGFRVISIPPSTHKDKQQAIEERTSAILSYLK